MNSESTDSSSLHPDEASRDEAFAPTASGRESSTVGSPTMQSTAAISSWAKSVKFSLPAASVNEDSKGGNAGKSAFARLASGFGLHLPTKASGETQGAASMTAQSGVFESLTKGLVDSSLSAVKAVQVKARHIVSQNKRRYQEGGFDLDMTYITENVIAMGFPAGDMSSGFFGYVEGFYRNHMEEVIKFFETHHKVMEDAWRQRAYGEITKYTTFVQRGCMILHYLRGRCDFLVASFPFDDHNCPPMELIPLFCQSAYAWLKEDIQNVVVVHCKAGMARTGLMICSLLLFLKFFPTAEECIEYYNQKRCIDGKGLILPSQIRYVKYFEHLLSYFNGENQPGRRCMLRGFRLHSCPYWIRPSITISDHNGILFSTRKHAKTKDLMPEDFWIRAPKKGIVVFALPGEPGLTELKGDFKIHFHDRQGDFYCWLNTSMAENRIILDNSELDGFGKRKLPSPGFQVEIVMIDYDGSIPTRKKAEIGNKESDGRVGNALSSTDSVTTANQNKDTENQDNDDVFSDSEGEETTSSKSSQARATSGALTSTHTQSGNEEVKDLTHGTQRLSLSKEATRSSDSSETKIDGLGRLGSGGMSSDIKAIAADASVFTFGDEEDYESE
ncbi:hypothetical protein RHSIM_Rhsim10G0113100 [Rhododendron simsii]|uniref:Uncharacterized protein n=1 Tax=Rhododendron simsii TaxID=118357 RepID=A0A834LCX4_RHOSS|nr:hypothetical protein RHSIM_Rhsim10G0113100 [Rhododendron simsii]